MKEKSKKGVITGGKVLSVVDTHKGKVKPANHISTEKRDKYQYVKNENGEIFGAKKVNTLYDPKKGPKKYNEENMERVAPKSNHDIKKWQELDESDKKKWQPFKNDKGEKMGIEKEYMPKGFLKDNLNKYQI